MFCGELGQTGHGVTVSRFPPAAQNTWPSPQRVRRTVPVSRWLSSPGKVGDRMEGMGGFLPMGVHYRPVSLPSRPWAPPEGRASSNRGHLARLPPVGDGVLGPPHASESCQGSCQGGRDGDRHSAHSLPSLPPASSPTHPPPCMMGKAILPLPPPLLLLPVWGGGGEAGAAAPYPSFLLICTHWPLQTRTAGASPSLPGWGL